MSNKAKIRECAKKLNPIDDLMFRKMAEEPEFCEGKIVGNGFTEVYVNATVKDGSEVAELMDVFTMDDAYNDKFPVTSRSKRRYKETEEGQMAMCEVVEQMIKEIVEEERLEGMREGRLEGRLEEKKATAIRLAGMGHPPGYTASVLDVGIETVRQWLGS